MHAIVIFTAQRIIEVGEPQAGQSKEEFLQLVREQTIDDPFAFIDVKDVQVCCSVLDVTPSEGVAQGKIVPPAP